jgi:hypothetical protein
MKFRTHLAEIGLVKNPGVLKDGWAKPVDTRCKNCGFETCRCVDLGEHNDVGGPQPKVTDLSKFRRVESEKK